MGHGQPPSIENTNSAPEKPEVKLARKANDSLQGDVSKQGFEGLNIQVNQMVSNDKENAYRWNSFSYSSLRSFVCLSFTSTISKTV